MRGRKPTPTARKVATGNPGKRPLPKNEPKPRQGIPTPPAHISDAARQAWGRLAKELNRAGVLTRMDGPALEELCEIYAELIDLREHIKKYGRFTATVGGAKKGSKGKARPTKTSPAVHQMADASKRFRMMMSEFGMTPSSRARVETTRGHVVEDEEEADPTAKYFD